MRKVNKSLFQKSYSSLDETLDTRVKDIVGKSSSDSNGFQYQFVIPAGATDYNSTGVDVTYTVDFSEEHAVTVPIVVPDVGKGSVRVKANELTFSNDLTGMGVISRQGGSREGEVSNQGVSAPLVFSTIARIIVRFIDRKDPPGISYTAANPGLTKVYKMLSLKAEKMSNFIWATKESLKKGNTGTYLLLPKNTYDSIVKTAKKDKQQTGE